MKNKSLSENLIYQRKLKGFTQESLSDKTNVGIRTIQRIEKGEVDPHMQTIKLLAEGLEIKVEDLIILDNPHEKEVERKWLFLFHLLPFIGFIIPFANLFIPLILWAVKSKDHPSYDNHARAVINFHASITLYLLISLLLFFAFPGYNYFLTIGIVLYSIVMCIYNIFKSMNSGRCYYPLSITFLKIKA